MEKEKQELLRAIYSSIRKKLDEKWLEEKALEVIDSPDWKVDRNILFYRELAKEYGLPGTWAGFILIGKTTVPHIQISYFLSHH